MNDFTIFLWSLSSSRSKSYSITVKTAVWNMLLHVSFVQWSSEAVKLWSSSLYVSSRLGVASWVISVSEAGSSSWPLTPGVVLQHCVTPTAPLPLLPRRQCWHLLMSLCQTKDQTALDPWVVAPVLICYYAWSSSHLFGWLTTQCVLRSAGSVCGVLLPSGEWWKSFSSDKNQAKHHASCFSFFFSSSSPGLLWEQRFVESGWVLHSASFLSASLKEPTSDLKWNHSTWSPPWLWSLS